MPDTATVTIGPDLRDRCADVIHAILMGVHGARARAHAQLALAGRWTDDPDLNRDNAPDLLADITHEINRHMHEIHSGHIARRLLLGLIDPAADPDDDEPVGAERTGV